MNNIKVIIIGVSHHNTYSMIRCFGEHGIKPILLLYGCEDSYILRSNYISESFVVASANAASEELIRKKEVWAGGLVISCTDAIASEIDFHYDSIKNIYHIFNCGETGKLTYYMNKLVQTKCAKDVGLAVPSSFEGLVNELKECSVPFPRIMKPVESIHGGKRISISQNQEEFDNSISNLNEADKVIVQQFIQKEYEIVIVGLAIGDTVVIPGYVHKYRDEKGGTTYATIKPAAELPLFLLEQCENLVKNMNYQGLFGIELIKQGDSYFFIEINLRNDATTYAIAKAGVNLPMALFENVVRGGDFNACLGKIREINSMVEFPDFIHVLRRKVSIFSWYKQLKNCDCKYIFSKEDREPFKVYRKEFIRFLIKRITKI